MRQEPRKRPSGMREAVRLASSPEIDPATAMTAAEEARALMKHWDSTPPPETVRERKASGAR